MRLQRNKNPNGQNGQYERLEDRRLLAGNVIVFEFENSLFIRADAADNQMQIVGEANGDIQITGLNGTTLNGQDQVITLSDRLGQISQDLRVHMGQGNDTLFVEGIQVNNRSVFYGGPGNDSVGYYNFRVLDDLFSNLSSGDDSMSLDDVQVGDNLSVFGLEDNDTIGLDQTVVSGRTYIVGGIGDDAVAVSNTVLIEVSAIFGNEGNDFVATNGLFAEDEISFPTGIGDDSVLISESDFQTFVFVNGDLGNDSFEVDDITTFANNPFVRNFESNVVADGATRRTGVYADLIVADARLGTIAEYAALTPEFSTLFGALQTTGLAEMLDGPGPFTVFAPLNSAFAALPMGTLEGMSTQQLTDLLKFHISTSVIFAADLAQLSEVDTMFGQSFSVDTTNGIVLNGSVTLSEVDLRAKNGVIHLLNAVLMPAA